MHGTFIKTFRDFIWGLGQDLSSFLLFRRFDIARPGVGPEASVKLFCLAFGFGYAWNSIISEGAKWAEKEQTK